MTTQEHVSYQVASKVSKSTYMKIKKLIDEGMFLNFSDFTRKAIEDELRWLGELEIISVGEASIPEVKKKIEDYLNQHQGPIYPSDIADLLDRKTHRKGLTPMLLLQSVS